MIRTLLSFMYLETDEARIEFVKDFAEKYELESAYKMLFMWVKSFGLRELNVRNFNLEVWARFTISCIKFF